MNENDGAVTVLSVTESTSVESSADEGLSGNSGGEREGHVKGGDFIGRDGGEIMVEVVGSDVFVDGVGGGVGLERQKGECGDLGKQSLEGEGGIGDGEAGGSDDLKSEEVGDLSSQVRDALMENGVGNVKQGEVVVIEEGLDIGKELSREEGDVVLDGEAKNSGTETRVGAATVIVGSLSGETQVVVEEVTVSESVGVIERGLAEEGVEQGTYYGHGEANAQDYLTSGQDDVLDDEAWSPAIETGALCSSEMSESLTTQTQLVLEEVEVVTKEDVLLRKCEFRDSVVVDKNSAFPAVDRSSTIELVCQATDGGAINTNAENLDPGAEVDAWKIDMMNKEEGLHSKHEVTETDVVDGNLHSSVEHQMLDVKTAGESSESCRIPGVSTPDTMEPFAGAVVARVDNSNCSDPIVEAPDNICLSVGGDVGEVNTAGASKGSLDGDCEVAAVSSVAVDVQVSSDADDGLALENREAVCSVASIDDVKDQRVEDEAVGKSSNIDVALCTVTKSYVDRTQYAIVNESTAIDSEVPNSIVEAPTTSNMDFVVSSKEFENVECEKETSGNADKHGVVPAHPESTFEEACLDGNEDAGMDIDEVMDWKDNVPGSNALGVTLSASEEDEHLKVEKVVGSSEIEVAQEDLEFTDEPNQIGDGGDVAFMELDGNTKFEVQEGTNDTDVDYEPMELDSLKGDVSVSDVGENAKASAQMDETGITSTVQGNLVISVENVLVAKEEAAVMVNKNAFNSKSDVMDGDVGLQKDEKVNSPVGRSKSKTIMQDKATSSDEQAITEIRDHLESGCQGNVFVSSHDTLEGSDAPSGKNEDLKVETMGGISVECGVVCQDLTQDAEVGDHDTSILVTQSTPLKENRFMQDEKHKTVVQQAGTCIHEVYHGEDTDSPITHEIMNKGASFVVHPDTVAGDDGESQPALTAASVPSVGNTASSCIDDLAAPLPDGIGSVEVNVISKDATSLSTEAPGTHLFDPTSNDIVKQATVAKDESSVVDGNPSMQAHSLEVQCVGFSDSEPIMGNLALDMDACPDVGKWKSQGAVNNENISLSHEANCIKDGGDKMENSVQLQVSECLDGAEAGDLTEIASIAGQEAEVEEGYTDGEQVDLAGEQKPGTLQKTTEVENLKAIDEKIPELCNPVSSMAAHQSFYLQPPEKEGLFSVSDLVWGKVRSHPWWPGQIFDPADASEKATKYHKKDCFLVAYFGDRTFAWNDATVLKPFRTHFSQIEKHNNSEAFRHAVSCALEEVSRRVELGLACSCMPQDAYDEIKFQVVENTGIKQESSRRYGVDKSAGVSLFEPEKLLDHVKALAQSPYDETDQLELVIAKAQLSSFSRYKGYPELPEFQFSGELSESESDTSESNEAIEYPASAHKNGEQGLDDKGKLKGDNSSSHKRKHSSIDAANASKKEKNLSDLMVETSCSTDAEDGPDGKGTSKLVTASGKKRKALDSGPDGADKSKSFNAAKVSTAASPTPKPSFKIGECIRRAASQLTGSPSILKGSNEKYLKVDGDDDQPTGFEVSVQTPGTSPRGRTSVSTDHSAVDVMLSQLHLAAQDPMKGYSFLNTIIPFFSSHRTSVVSELRRHKSSTGRSGGSRKRKASNEASNIPEEFEFDDVNDSYWTDRVIQNSSEEQLLQDGQNGGVEYQPVVLEPKKPVKSGRKSNSRKRFSSSTLETQTEEPAEHVDRRKHDLPTELALSFAVGVSVPSEMNLNKTFRRFGPLMESETEVDSQASRARVVFKRCSDAEVAYSSAGKFNLFGSKLVIYELNYSPLVSYKPLPLPTLQGPEDAT